MPKRVSEKVGLLRGLAAFRGDAPPSLACERYRERAGDVSTRDLRCEGCRDVPSPFTKNLRRPGNGGTSLTGGIPLNFQTPYNTHRRMAGALAVA